MPLSLNLSLPLLLQLSRAAWQVWFMFSYGKDHGSQQPPTAARFWWGSAARLQHIQYEKTVCTVLRTALESHARRGRPFSPPASQTSMTPQSRTDPLLFLHLTLVTQQPHQINMPQDLRRTLAKN